MARRKNRQPVLPGLSRSAACSTTCQRLAGHKGEHRGTLTATKSQSTVRPEVLAEIEAVERKLEELRRLAQLPAKPAAKPVVKARRPKAAKVAQCRVVRDGVRCGRAYGHKQAGKRHSFAGRVVQLPEAGPEGRDVQPVVGKSSRRSRFMQSGRPSGRLA